MSPTRRVLPRAFTWSLLAAVLGAATASAQYFDPAVTSLDLTTGSVARSPRLLGMGGLSVVVPDRDTKTNLWDFAGMPVGLASDDSTSTMDIRPGTGALYSVRRLGTGLERQNLAARSTATGFEGVYRNRETGSSFGVVGDLSGLRWDRPYSSDIERREVLSHPEAMGVLGGVVPRFFHGHLAWAAHLRFRGETVDEQYRAIIKNSTGEWIDLNGTEIDAPSEFEPTKVTVTTSAYGLSTAYSIGQRGKLALGVEHEGNRIVAINELKRSKSETQETRPYWIGRAAIIGGLGSDVEFGVEGTGRVSDSERDWRFTTSAGVGVEALSGRGNMLTRKEKSSELRARVRWTPGKAVFAGTLQTGAHKITVDPPDDTDPTSFNRFMNTAFNRPNADTLAFPDSIAHDEARRWAVAAGGGASYVFGRTLVGVEYHWSRDMRTTTVVGEGPRRIAYDVRAGMERPLGALMKLRLGYAYRSVDEDDFTTLNEYTANAASVGLGYAPVNTRWSLETGFTMEFRGREDNDPADERQNRHHLAAQLHWAF